MATVYLAEDLKHHRTVAVKVLRRELAAAIGSERFLREIEITATLNHPHILPLLDSGSAEGNTAGPSYRPTAIVYYVMPYVEGESLRQRLNRETQLPIDDALAITGHIAAALDYAHRHNVLHRDIKPENVLLHEGEAVVADFGIALAVCAAGGAVLKHVLELYLEYFYTHFVLGCSYKVKGLLDLAIGEYEKALAASCRAPIARGEEDQAFHWFEKALEARDIMVPFSLNWPDEDLRFPDPERFLTRVRQVGLWSAGQTGGRP